MKIIVARYVSIVFIILVTNLFGNSGFNPLFCQSFKNNSRNLLTKGYKWPDNIVSYRDNDNNGFVKGLVKVKVYGNLKDFAYYYVYIGIGNPKAKQMVIIDTGSQLVNVACAGCLKCGKHMMENYNYDASMTSNLVTCKSEKCVIVDGKCDFENGCKFTENYNEGSTASGKYVGDLITFDSSKDSSDLSTFFDYIGCINEESNLIKTQISNGILGLSKSDKNSLVDNEYYETQSFIEKYLTDHFKPKRKIFSLCLSENGGVMTLGGHDRDLDLKMNNITGMTWIPMVKSEFYVIQLFRINIATTTFDFKIKNFVLDTGTTVSTVDKHIFNKIYNHFKTICEENIRLGKSLKSISKCKIDEKNKKICFSDIAKLPSIELIFKK